MFILYVVGDCSAQKETTWWYFNENAGIEFSQLPPIANIDVNDSIFNNGINGSEDVTSFSDSNGRLLFYASLTDVLKKKHQTMPNGILNVASFFSSSSEQGALIIPNPKNLTPTHKPPIFKHYKKV